jgi:hypothetical protein
MPEVACPIDGTKFWIAPSHLKRLTRPPTCSPECKAKSMKGKQHWNYKEGRYIDSEGYVRVLTDTGYQFEHRLVMAKKLGRPLKPGEIVHHIDEDRQNNSPRNLELYSDRGTHTTTEHVDRSRRSGKFKIRNVAAKPTKRAGERRRTSAFTRLAAAHRQAR